VFSDLSSHAPEFFPVQDYTHVRRVIYNQVLNNYTIHQEPGTHKITFTEATKGTKNPVVLSVDKDIAVTILGDVDSLNCLDKVIEATDVLIGSKDFAQVTFKRLQFCKLVDVKHYNGRITREIVCHAEAP
jgi:hypothetical protein